MKYDLGFMNETLIINKKSEKTKSRQKSIGSQKTTVRSVFKNCWVFAAGATVERR